MSQSFQPDPWQTGPDVESKLQDWRFKKYDEQFQYLASLPVQERMQIIQEHMSPGGRWHNELNNLLPDPDSRVAYKGMHAPTNYFPLNALGHLIASNKFDPYGQAYEAGEGLPEGYRHRETGELLANGFLPEDETSHLAVLSGIQDYKTGNPQLTTLNTNSNDVLVGQVEKGSSFPTPGSFDSEDVPVLEGKVEYKKRWPSWEKLADVFKFGSDVLGPSLSNFLQANAQRTQARKRQGQEQADEAVSQALNRKRSGHYEEGNKVPETQLKHFPLTHSRNTVGSQLPEMPRKNNINLPFRSLDREGFIAGPNPVAGFEDPWDYVGNLDNAMPQYKPFAENNFTANERLRNPDEMLKMMQVQQQQQRLAQNFPSNSEYVRRPRDYSIFSSRDGNSVKTLRGTAVQNDYDGWAKLEHNKALNEKDLNQIYDDIEKLRDQETTAHDVMKVEAFDLETTEKVVDNVVNHAQRLSNGQIVIAGLPLEPENAGLAATMMVDNFKETRQIIKSDELAKQLIGFGKGLWMFAYGDDINTLLDPKAPAWEKALAAANFIPAMKITKVAKIAKFIRLGDKLGDLKTIRKLVPIHPSLSEVKFWSSGYIDGEKVNGIETAFYKAQKHMHKLGITNESEYIAKAHDFFTHTPVGTEVIITKKGTKILYQEATNTMLVAKNNAPLSFYRPKTGRLQFDKNIRKGGIYLGPSRH